MSPGEITIRPGINELIDQASALATAGAPMVHRERIKEYLLTGDYTWAESGEGFLRDFELQAAHSEAAKRAVLLILETATTHIAPPDHPITQRDIQQRIEPMVRGMLPTEWQEVALRELVRRTFVLDLPGAKRAIEAELSTGFLGTAQEVLFHTLADHGIDVGDVELRWEGAASGEYAHIRRSRWKSDDPYCDVVVHEAAHMLHYLKPAHYGLKVKRNQERFVDVEYRHRELFAYACEAYARASQIPDRRQRIAFAVAMQDKAPSFPADMLADVGDLLLKAARARSGWRVIQEVTRIRPRKWRDQLKTASAAVPVIPVRDGYST